MLLLTIHVGAEPVASTKTSHFDMWFIVQFFRDTLARNFHALEETHYGNLKRGSFFRKIRNGGANYLAYEDVRRLMASVMLSAVDNLEEDLRLLKQFASKIVKELTDNGLMLDMECAGIEYLTCVRIEREDIPCYGEG